jgi:hypothetical protein
MLAKVRSGLYEDRHGRREIIDGFRIDEEVSHSSPAERAERKKRNQENSGAAPQRARGCRIIHHLIYPTRAGESTRLLRVTGGFATFLNAEDTS